MSRKKVKHQSKICMSRKIISILLVIVAIVSTGEGLPKKQVAIDKHANTDFIRMEGGLPPPQQQQNKPQIPISTNHNQSINKPPAQKSNYPVPPANKPANTQQILADRHPAVVNPSIHSGQNRNPVSTPGPKTIQHLITYYDSQGKASVIRPYDYSQAVKQG